MNIEYVFQPSLFGDFHAVDREHLEELLRNTDIVAAVRRGIQKAELEYQEINEKPYLTERDKSSDFHSCICFMVLEEIRALNLDEVSTSYNHSGNNRHYFTVRGYTFIFKNLDTNWNRTEQADRIQKQICMTPVVLLLYKFNPLTGLITSAKFLYASSDFRYIQDIDLSPAILQIEMEDFNNEIIRPTLKQDISQKNKKLYDKL